VVRQRRAVEAVAPCGVLQRATADLGPEAGYLAPCRVTAGGADAGDLTHGEPLTPVLDGQPPPSGRVVRPGDVPGGEDVRRRRAHPLVDHHPARTHGQAGCRGQGHPRPYPGSHEDQVGGKLAVSSQAQRKAFATGFERFHRHAAP